MATSESVTYKLKPEEKPKSKYGLETAYRVPLQLVKGGATKLAGEFGDLPAFVHEGIANPLAEQFGKKPVPYEESTLGQILPTTYQHQKNLEEGASFLKPRNEAEKFANDLGQDIVSLFLPSRYGRLAGRLGGATQSLIKSTAIALGANALGETVKEWTGDEQKGAIAKTGSMMMMNLFNPGGARAVQNELYNDARNLLPQNAAFNPTRLRNNLNQQRNSILGNRGLEDLSTDERFVVNEIDKILRNIQQNNLAVQEALRMRTSLNNELERHVYSAPPGTGRNTLRRKATRINHALNEGLEEYGRTNPQWWQTQRSADQAHGAIEGSNFISRIVRDHFPAGSLSPHLVHLLTGVSAGAGAVLPYMAVKTAYQMIKSPELRRYYGRLFRNASQGGVENSVKIIQKMDDKIKEEEKKEKYKFVD